MKQILNFFAIIFLFLYGASVINAQANLNGRYVFKAGKETDSPSFSLKFERRENVYFSYFYEGAGTVSGKWTLENGIIKVVLSRGADWTLRLKQNGNDLKIVESLPQMTLPDVPDFRRILLNGTIFKKNTDHPTGPDLTPEEVGGKILKLVKSIKTVEDISPENIKRQTEISVVFHPDRRNEYGFGGNVIGGADWVYGIFAYPYPSKDNKTTDTLRFSFDYQLHEPLHPDTTIISKAFNFDSLSKELQDVGFSAPKPHFGQHNYISGWTFTRGKVEVLVGVKGGFEPNINNSVKSIQITF